jgi:hypothetical protein
VNGLHLLGSSPGRLYQCTLLFEVLEVLVQRHVLGKGRGVLIGACGIMMPVCSPVAPHGIRILDVRFPGEWCECGARTFVQMETDCTHATGWGDNLEHMMCILVPKHACCHGSCSGE